MAIDEARIMPYLEDYADVTGKRVDRFVCPITLRECEPDELIEGHILNDALKSASRKTIPQYGKVDHFYGGKVEPSLITFLNSKGKTPIELLKSEPTFTITFPDGTTAPGFFADTKKACKAGGHLPYVELREGDKIVARAFVNTTMDDPRLSGSIEINFRQYFYPLYWVAALQKSAHLTMFDLLGYRAVFSPFGETIRWSLNGFYEDGGGIDSAHRHFSDFRQAVKIAFPADPAGESIYQPLGFDTLNNGEVVLHRTPSETLFAVSCILQINDVTVTVILPETLDQADAAIAWEWYQGLMKDVSVASKGYRAKFANGAWHFDPRSFALRHLKTPDE